MYLLASQLTGMSVISLQTGETVATVAAPVINLEQLRLVGFRLNVGRSPRDLLVMSGVRQLAIDCVIIDSDEELAEPDDVVRLAPLVKSGYTPLNKTVATESGRTLGVTEDYTINLDTELVQKLYIRPPLFRAWFSSNLIIDRSQIIDIQPTRFIIRDAFSLVGHLAAEATTAEPS